MQKTKEIDRQLRELVVTAAAEHGSVNRLCKAAEVPQASVSAWLAGAQAGLSWSVVSRLCDYLGVRLAAAKRAKRAG